MVHVMKSLALATVLFCGAVSAAFSQNSNTFLLRGQGYPISVSGTTTGQSLLNGISGESIKVSYILFLAGTATSASFGWSTSTSCTSITALTGNLNLTSAYGASAGDGAAAIMFVPSGDTLCIITNGSLGGWFTATQDSP